MNPLHRSSFAPLRRSLAALACAALLSASSGCSHLPTEKERAGAMIHYDLGISAQSQGEVQAAYREFEEALKLDPNLPEAHQAMGLLLHLAFRRPEQAIGHYQKALESRPDFSEVKTNLGNVYLDLGRYDDAIAQYQLALNDMLYPTPFIAHGNWGWALYKKGEVASALDHIKVAVTLNPKFCLGYKNLGLILEQQGQLSEACGKFTKYREACPEVADAYYREGACRAKVGDSNLAKTALTTCQEKAGNNDTLKEDCRRLAEAVR